MYNCKSNYLFLNVFISFSFVTFLADPSLFSDCFGSSKKSRQA
ncbi:hypothetical protein GCWU000325_02547 [Alloprevotella tannerae ATCC 51259]|uniref:Uncharacterized protein n=1 Tax=Alloprevotella tannerae ATCC 51259 TaxID=626522 RepID=C9LJY3_9BACT|nr:hypothetical protein GCWU000325_02547 [Alloprevotella tannerae ATCC 51259]